MTAIFGRRNNLFAQLALTLLALVFVAPLVMTARVSLQGEGLGNYSAVLTQPLLPQFFLNSAIVTSGTILLTYAITVLAAYAFSKLDFGGKGLLFNAVLAGLTLPGVAVILPMFIVVRRLNLFDNYLAVILPLTAFGLPFALLQMRNFLDGLPNELLDAARIDGCNSFTCLTKIVLPLIKPITVVVILLTFLGAWNEYFLGLVFMQDESRQLITQLPQYFIEERFQDTGKVFAALVLISLPVMLAYLSLQRYFEDGLVSGSLK
ncbi:MAG: carbohydrate ABC transporter permease [Chloroflexota bacterium]|nr:carbohydrate ABC transporter permease [Chloroflexota bacterium]